MHPLNTDNIVSASTIPGSTVAQAEVTKISANSVKCAELGWQCVPMAFSVYGEISDTAGKTLTSIASRLAAQTSEKMCFVHILSEIQRSRHVISLY